MHHSNRKWGSCHGHPPKYGYQPLASRRISLHCSGPGPLLQQAVPDLSLPRPLTGQISSPSPSLLPRIDRRAACLCRVEDPHSSFQNSKKTPKIIPTPLALQPSTLRRYLWITTLTGTCPPNILSWREEPLPSNNVLPFSVLQGLREKAKNRDTRRSGRTPRSPPCAGISRG